MNKKKIVQDMFQNMNLFTDARMVAYLIYNTNGNMPMFQKVEYKPEGDMVLIHDKERLKYGSVQIDTFSGTVAFKTKKVSSTTRGFYAIDSHTVLGCFYNQRDCRLIDRAAQMRMQMTKKQKVK